MKIRYDGMVAIRCSDCGKIVSTQPYPGFSTVICVDCQKKRDEIESNLVTANKKENKK